MTNFEYYKDEIKKYIDDMANFTVSKGEIMDCDDVRCDHCEINDSTYSPCEIGRIKWLYEEHKETLRLTAKEYAYLSFLEEGYIVRSKDTFGEDIRVYCNKPKLGRDFADGSAKWYGSELKALINANVGLFDFVKAGDEPYSIEEMLTWEHEEED